MDRRKFKRRVAQAVRNLPDEFAARLENIALVVQSRPTARQMARAGLKHGQTLLGLYEGLPLTKRSDSYGLVLPDKITIFQGPIESLCKNEAELTQEIKRVVLHEIAHHFGIDDARLKQLENRKT